MSKDEVKVGDIVTSGRAGYWRVAEIEPNASYGRDRAKLEQVLDKHGNPPRKRARAYVCWRSYCKKITVEDIAVWREASNKKWDTLLKSVNPEIITESDEELLEELGIEVPEPEFLKNLGPPPSLLENRND